MVIPALLTDKKETLSTMIDSCADFCDYVQVDIMDGDFVPSNSVSLSDLEGWKSKTRCEAHLMVNDPLKWIKTFKDFGAERIVYHFEAKLDHPKIIEEIEKRGLKPGLAVNPPTKISEFESLVSKVDTVLFLSVNPGFYGADFIPEVLDKIREFKKSYPEMSVGIDGGIKLDNLLKVKESGVDYVCVGSAILKAAEPKEAYNKFVELFYG